MDGMTSEGNAEKIISGQSTFVRPAYEYLMDSCFAGLWDREGLDRKYRSLTVIS